MSQHISVASIRRAAEKIRHTGPVTEMRIAEELNVEPRVVCHYVRCIKNLKNELGIQGRVMAKVDYIATIRLLEERGVLVTVRRIAFFTGSSKANIREWLRRHAVHATWISTEHDVHRYAIAQQARWNAVSCRNDLGTLNMTTLAYTIGLERISLYRILKKWPSLKRELQLKR